MELMVNGEARRHDDEATLKALLHAMAAEPGKVAVLLNGEMVPRTQHNQAVLAEGDTVEVFEFAGGG